MGIEDENAPLPPFDAASGSIRLDWDKTAKSSAHNNAVKNQVVASLKDEHPALYPDVPKREFSQKAMEKAFDDVLASFRARWRGSNGEARPSFQRRGRSASGTGIKKAKLERRINARNMMKSWSRKAFDGCFQVECMSDEEDDSVANIPWRSTRLVRFFDDLDEETIGSVVRRTDGFTAGPLPPKGIARWMVSKRWEAQWKGKEEEKILENLYASDDEEEPELGDLGPDSESDLSELDEPQA